VFLKTLTQPVGSGILVFRCGGNEDSRGTGRTRYFAPEIVVTGDEAMLAVGDFEGIRLITLADYLDLPPKRGGKRRR
jgi:hypothetical protein